MHNEFQIVIVEDSKSARQLLELSLQGDYPVKVFESAEACLEGLSDAAPALFLLDVELPGMNGYHLCERLKQTESICHVPVLFISTHSELESRLQGYDVGGIDYIAKPFDIDELKKKIEVIREIYAHISQSKSQRQQIDESEQLTELLLANADEYAVLLNFLRQLNSSLTQEDIAQNILGLLSGLKLKGAVQMRLFGQEETYSTGEKRKPLDTAVIAQMSDMGRLLHFRDRCICNYEFVSILVHNMPKDDADRCGRLRDHLAIAAEAADAKLHNVVIAAHLSTTQGGMQELAAQLQQQLDEFSGKFQQAQAEGTVISRRLIDTLMRSFAHLGLTTEQEDRVELELNTGIEQLVALYDMSDSIHGCLHEIRDGIDRLAQTT